MNQQIKTPVVPEEGDYQVRHENGTIFDNFPAADDAEVKAIAAADKISGASVWRFNGTGKDWQRVL
ncbi:MAG: hypothetical protein RXR20_00820 [Paraburkholderia sp.]|jgi:hypothetical protein|uniref:hypothetical protein n=1 Tax=Burkholderiaceae TaxID=119060 RepID=UPI0010F6B69B|nr:hypothetical protein [Burkholderia sp. 4M9327F10]